MMRRLETFTLVVHQVMLKYSISIYENIGISNI